MPPLLKLRCSARQCCIGRRWAESHIQHTVGLRWDGITSGQKAQLDSCLEAHGARRLFWYKPYGFLEVIKWTCEEWSSTTKAPLTYAAKLIQSYSLTA
jgi:phage-related protein